MTTQTRVGFIGLGSQGGPMARRIVEAGYETRLWARREASLEPYADTAAKPAASPAELAAASDLVCLCVVSDADVEHLVTGDEGILAGAARGTVVAVHSTIHPETCRRLAGLGRPKGVEFVDAPVSGGGMAAEAGTLLVMVGGAEPTVEKVRPVFETYGNPVVHLGPLGSGQAAKLLNNLVFTANLGTAAAMIELGSKLGVDVPGLLEALTHGSGNSFALTRVAAAGGAVDRIATRAGSLLRKDVGLISDLAEAANADPGVVMDAARATLALIATPTSEPSPRH